MYKQVPTFQAVRYVMILRLHAMTRGIIAHTFEVPVEGYGTHDETNEGEDCIEQIRRGTHCRLDVRVQLAAGSTWGTHQRINLKVP